jgi:hypothetical protein
MVICRGILLGMRNFSNKSYREKNTHILSSVTFFPENRAVYEIIWENVVQPERRAG